MKDRIKRIIRKLPTAILMWFTVLFLVVSILNLTGIYSLGGLWPLLWVILVIGVPIAVPVVCLREKFAKVPFIQKWWVWLIGAICAIVLIAITTEPAPPEVQSPTTTTETTAATTEATIETTEATVPTTEATVETTEATEPTTEAVETTQATTAPTEPPSPEDVFIEAFCSGSGLKEETAQKIYRLLHDEMHFSEIQFSGKNAVAQINWDILADGYEIMLTADDDGVYRAICGSFVLYENSQVAMTKEEMEARMYTYEDATYYYVIAQDIVSSALVSPSSARFCSKQECGMGKSGDIVVVQGYVESKNSFGVMLKSNFTVQFYVIDLESFIYEPLYIEIGGQTAGEFVEMD